MSHRYEARLEHLEHSALVRLAANLMRASDDGRRLGDEALSGPTPGCTEVLLSRDILSLIMRQEDVPETVAKWATTCKVWEETARERLAAMKRLQFLDSAAYDEYERFQWMTTLPGGNFCVAAPDNSKLLVFGPDGTILSTMQMPAPLDDWAPVGVAVNGQHFYVSSEEAVHKLLVVDDGSLELVASLSSADDVDEEEADLFSNPCGLEFVTGPHGPRVFVADNLHDRIVVLDPSEGLRFVTTITAGEDLVCVYDVAANGENLLPLEPGARMSSSFRWTRTHAFVSSKSVTRSVFFGR